MADKETERIKFETEVLKLTAIAVLAIGGGSVGLLLSAPSLFRVILASGELLVTVGLMVLLWWQRKRILVLIEQMEENTP